MDELLNSGVGGRYFVPMPQDPDDDRTNEEKMRDGCIASIFYLITVILFFFVLSCVTSCGTQKSTLTTQEVINIDSTKHKEVRTEANVKDSSFTAASISTVDSLWHSVIVDVLDFEIVNESIIETTDTAGNTTKTTNRTTMRKHNDHSQSSSGNVATTEQQGIDISIVSARSAMSAAEDDSNTLSYYNDIHQQESEREPSCWEKLLYFVRNIVFAIIVFALLFLMYKYWNGK